MFKNYLNVGYANVYPQNFLPLAAVSAAVQQHSAQMQQPPTHQPAPLLSRNLVYGMAPFRVPSFANYPRNSPQKLMIVRHAERVDSYYGLNWVENAFTYNGMYCRFDYNMPKDLIPRENPYDFEFDPPLTENGLNQARLHGEELARLGIKITHCYSSPALRSIQTADKILEGMNLKDKVPIRIEVGLFELLSWQSYLPCRYPFIDKHTLRAYGYNIDVNYESILNYENLKPDENINDFYFRSHYVTKMITDAHLMDGGNLMFVGHAPSLEGCSRQLIGEPVRNLEEFLFINRQITFLSMAQCERNQITGKWELTPIRTSNCDESPGGNGCGGGGGGGGGGVGSNGGGMTTGSVALSSDFMPNSAVMAVANVNKYLPYECQSNQIYHDPYQAFYA